MALSRGQERSVEHQVDALARRDHRLRRRVGRTPQVVGEWTGGVDHHLGARFHLLAGLGIAEADAVHEAIAVFRHLRDFGVVEQRRALFAGRRHQVDQQAGVVKLAVEVDHPAF